MMPSSSSSSRVPPLHNFTMVNCSHLGQAALQQPLARENQNGHTDHKKRKLSNEDDLQLEVISDNEEPVKKKKKARKRAKKSDKKKNNEGNGAATLGDLVRLAAQRGSSDNENKPAEDDSDDDTQDTIEKQESNVHNTHDVDETKNTESRREWSEEMPILTEEDFSGPLKFEFPVDDCDEEITKTIKAQMVQPNPFPAVVALSTDAYYEKCQEGVCSTTAMKGLELKFESMVRDNIGDARRQRLEAPRPATPPFHHNCKCGHDSDTDSSSDTSSDEEGAAVVGELDENTDLSTLNDKSRGIALQKLEVKRKRTYPSGMHPDLCFNEPNLGNDGPVCRCSLKAKDEGLRHYRFAGEERIEPCNLETSNSSRLYHYVLRVHPLPHEGVGRVSQIQLGQEVYDLNGFSLFFHRPLPKLMPKMPISRFTTETDFELVYEKNPECYTVGQLELIYSYVFEEMLELYDISRRAFGVNDGCPYFHVMPRFVYSKSGTPKLLPMNVVIPHLKAAYSPMLPGDVEKNLLFATDNDFVRWSCKNKGILVMNPEKRPSTFRVDEMVRGPDGVRARHHAYKPASYTSQTNPEQQRLQRRLNKMRHLVGLKQGAASQQEKDELAKVQQQLDALRRNGSSQRTSTVEIPARNLRKTGLYPDITHHALLLVLACHHVRLHWSLAELEKRLSYSFRNRKLLELALIHPSFKNHYGTNPDQAKNTLSNCGYRRKAQTDDHRKKEKKRGINTLLQIMQNSGKTNTLNPSLDVVHNERLEYLGDAVVELVVSNRLFFLLPHYDEGGLATFRSALVRNKNLAVLGKAIRLHEWLLFGHAGDLCHEADFRHAIANAFEALMAAVYLDSNLETCDRIFADAMYGHDQEALERWLTLPEHRLKTDKLGGDREMMESVDMLKGLAGLEERLGIQFQHIRMLAQALTRRCIPFNHITYHNERLEWLGDTVLQLIVSEYLYRTFPTHHEGHLSLLRTCLVSNKTQAVVCDDLGLWEYAVKPQNGYDRPAKLRTKDKADLVESLIGSIFVDKGWQFCRGFVRICFLPRLRYFINQNRWNDPKSQLQQYCLALRKADSKDPEIPIYRKIAVEGCTNKRRYRVAVYFRNTRLAESEGSNVHVAEMNAAYTALMENKDLFPFFHRSLGQKQTLPSSSNSSFAKNKQHVIQIPTHVVTVDRPAGNQGFSNNHHGGTSKFGLGTGPIMPMQMTPNQGPVQLPPAPLMSFGKPPPPFGAPFMLPPPMNLAPPMGPPPINSHMFNSYHNMVPPPSLMAPNSLCNNSPMFPLGGPSQLVPPVVSRDFNRNGLHSKWNSNPRY